MLKNIFNSFFRVNHIRFSSSIVSSSNTIQPIKYEAISESPFVSQPREVWLENMDTAEVKRLRLMTLHPEIFADTPRIDVIHRNVHWQKMYRFISFAHTKTRAECRGGGKKKFNWIFKYFYFYSTQAESHGLKRVREEHEREVLEPITSKEVALLTVHDHQLSTSTCFLS